MKKQVDASSYTISRDTTAQDLGKQLTVQSSWRRLNRLCMEGRIAAVQLPENRDFISLAEKSMRARTLRGKVRPPR